MARGNMEPREWRGCTDPGEMLEFLACDVREYTPPQTYDRKLRLFACACCRQMWDSLTDERCRCAVEMAERYAYGQVTAEALHEAIRAAEGAPAEPAVARLWAA